jgi:hypothetical protein
MKIRIQTPPNPAPGRRTFFIDPDKNPSQKNASGTTNRVGLTGDPITLDEGSAPTPDADGVWLYSKDVGGISELFVMDGDGNEIQVTNAGSIEPAATGSAFQFWSTQDGASEFDSGLSPLPPTTPTAVSTGLILAPAPGVPSVIHFRMILALVVNDLGGIYAEVGGCASPAQYVGWVAFNSSPGTPAARATTGWLQLVSGYTGLEPNPDTGVDFGGCTISITDELVLNFITPSLHESAFSARIVASSVVLPADLT